MAHNELSLLFCFVLYTYNFVRSLCSVRVLQAVKVALVSHVEVQTHLSELSSV